jgi:hypothetical protein
MERTGVLELGVGVNGAAKTRRPRKPRGDGAAVKRGRAGAFERRTIHQFFITTTLNAH